MEETQLKILKKFFKNEWVPNHYDKDLVEEVNALRPRAVLDVGCGYNPYKGKIHNLFGIDIVIAEADQICDVLDFNPGRKYDVVMALGSLNFGATEDILARLRHIRTLIEDDGTFFLRVNPGILWPTEPNLRIYPWTHEKIAEYAKSTGFRLAGEIDELATERGTRIKFVYKPV